MKQNKQIIKTKCEKCNEVYSDYEYEGKDYCKECLIATIREEDTNKE